MNENKNLPTQEELEERIRKNDRNKLIVMLLGTIVCIFMMRTMIAAAGTGSLFAFMISVNAIHTIAFIKTIDNLLEEYKQLKTQYDNHEYK